MSSWWTDDVSVQRVQLGGNVKAVAFSPNGRYLAADGYDGNNTNITIYDVSNIRSVQQIDPDVFEVQALAFSPDGRYLAVGGYDPAAIIFYRIGTEDITSRTQIAKEETIQVSGEVHDLAWSPDGNLISDGRAVYQTTNLAAPISSPADISLSFPEDLISEEAFGTYSTYFILRVKHPTLMDTTSTETYYQNCEIILHIPDGTQAFMFPIQTQGEKASEALKDVAISAGELVLNAAGIGVGIGLLGLLNSMIELYEVFRDGLGRDLKIEIPGSSFTAGRPDTEIEYVVLLKNETQTLNSLDITIKQTYRLGWSFQRYDIQNTSTWNFGEGWAAARAAHPLTLSDYRPFQLLPLEVQQYLLSQSSVFGMAEASLIPAKTVVEHNYPNPFNPETWISYQLAESSEVTVSIYSVDGRLVRKLNLGYQTAGVYQGKGRAAYWDGRNEFGEYVASGVYFYTFVAGNFSAAGKMLMMK